MKMIRQITVLCLIAVLGITGCARTAGREGKIRLTFNIWDKAQAPGMEAMAKLYTSGNPGVSIDVQVTSWDEYWVKLEASAIGNKMPDIFWMHTNNILIYAEYGMLADVTDLYSDVSPAYYTDHFSEISIKNASGGDGRMYGVPKDKDVVCLIYNKDIFDRAGVAYPDENWTWDNLVEASRTIHAKTGIYGYAAYMDEQLGYWNFVYQAGGYILNEDGTRPGFTNPATGRAMQFYVDLQKEDFCPDQYYFSETSPGDAFFSGKCAMYFEGNWMLRSCLENYPNMVGSWDVAVLPKCPAPARGDGRATISNGLCYSTGAKGKNLKAALDFIKFLGTEEAMLIQGDYGTAIPAYIGTENNYIESFNNYSYRLNIENILEMFPYGVQYVNNLSRQEWRPKVSDELLKAYTGRVSVDQALDNMQRIVETAIANF